MTVDSYVLLGFKVKSREPLERVLVYEVSQRHIAQARNCLIRDNIPHVVFRSRETSELDVFVTSRSTSLEEKLGLKPREKEPPSIECEFIGSAVRLKFLNSGWKRAVGKLYNHKMIEFNGADYGIPINMYMAVKINVDKLRDGSTILFIDPAKKVEFTESLSDIEERDKKILSEITWVKIKEAAASFYVVRNTSEEVKRKIEEKTSDRDFRERLARVLSEYCGVNIRISYGQGFVEATPKSSVLAGLLRKEVGVPIMKNDIPIVPLPKDILKPVASMDNINLFINDKDLLEKMTFLILPKDRLRKTEEIIWDIDLRSLKFNGLNVEIDVDDGVVSLSEENFSETRVSEYFAAPEGMEISKILAGWNPDFTKVREDQESEATVIPIILKLPSTDIQYNRAVKKAINELKKLSEGYGLKYLSELVCEPNISDILSKMNGILRAYGKKNLCSILFFHRSFDSTYKFIDLYKYHVAMRGVYAYAIDLTEDERDAISWKIKSVLKKFAVKINALSYKLKPPQVLESYIVAGVDSTLYATERGGLYPVVVVTILNTDGKLSVETFAPGIGFSDADALALGVKSIVDQYGDNGLLLILNKSSLSGVLQRLKNIVEDFPDRVLRRSLIVTSVSKTHSYSRILVRRMSEIYNPRKPGVLVWLSGQNYDLGNDSIHVSRFLSVTTTYPSERFEKGTVKPVLINIASKHDTRDQLEIAKYLVSLPNFARISSAWAPSLPMPLHAANVLSRKLHRILKVMEYVRHGVPGDINNIIKYI